MRKLILTVYVAAICVVVIMVRPEIPLEGQFRFGWISGLFLGFTSCFLGSILKEE